MSRLPFLPSLGLVALAACCLPAAAQVPARDSAGATARSIEGPAAERAVKKGFLFSAVCFGDSALGSEWGRLRAEAVAKFPDLKIAKVADLHITVVYVGGDWKPDDLDRYRASACVVPTVAGRMTPQVVRMGRNDQVVAVELLGAPGAWTDSVIAAKARLNALGLKKPDNYDTSFRTHVTIAEARHTPPNETEAGELTACLAWMTEQVGTDPARFSVTVGPRTQVRLLLAGATRPDDAPEYIPVEDFIARQPGTGAKR